MSIISLHYLPFKVLACHYGLTFRYIDVMVNALRLYNIAKGSPAPLR